MQGASALVSFYSLRGLIDMLQIFALILNTIGKAVISPNSLSVCLRRTAHGAQLDTWKKIILGTM